jgi:hypothetical protein
MTHRLAASAGLVLVVLTLQLGAQAPVPFMGMGDSIGEGVQSADANWRTQPASYLSLIARQMGVQFPLPLIASTGLGFVDVVNDSRKRLFPGTVGLNVAVSGTDSSSILSRRAEGPIDTETDLVISPRTGSQIEVIEATRPFWVACWIGSNDALGAVTSFDQLDASQMTSVVDFAANYTQLVSRLQATGARVVLANIPDVDQIAFLMGPADLIRFTGDDFGLPQGSFTSLIGMLLLKSGISGPSLLQNPDWVLDATEAQTIRDRIAAFNAIIAAQAALAGYPVVNINALFKAVAANPPVIQGVPLTPRLLGGMFSLDGIHPSNIAHAIVADYFIATMNARYGTSIPRLTAAQKVEVFLNDPFVDRDGDLKVAGRPFAGVLETLAPFLGLSGDDESAAARTTARVDRTIASRFMRAYYARSGKDPNRSWTRADAIEAFRTVFAMRQRSE